MTVILKFIQISFGRCSHCESSCRLKSETVVASSVSLPCESSRRAKLCNVASYKSVPTSTSGSPQTTVLMDQVVLRWRAQTTQSVFVSCHEYTCTCIHTNIQTNKQNTQTNRQTDQHTNTQTSKHTNKQANKERNTQTYKNTYIHIQFSIHLTHSPGSHRVRRGWAARAAACTGARSGLRTQV